MNNSHVPSFNPKKRTAVGPWSDLALHTIGWRAFQDLCSQVCEVALGRPVEIYREAQDGGQDAVFLIPSSHIDGSTVGTVQCKHSSDPNKNLGLSDVTAEIAHVTELVKLGQADTYVFMTNMSVDAPVAIKIRRKLQDLGVRKPHVFGKQYIIRTIRESPRLRALVPQVYGLGDLTLILDERLSQQSRALLEHWVPKLKMYVPTKAHRAAVRALTEHGIVLLLGNPSSGKSAIGAILSTIASENPNHTVFAITSPKEFEQAWNPSDPGRFFWIDDAFGPNVLRDDYVQDWTSAFRKIQASITKGNKFLLTSRKHIYESAKRKLGQRNLQTLIDGSATVDVGNLSPDERAQILYNHINYGQQSQSWKANVKKHLSAVANAPNFLAGIAERLGDPAFTKGLALHETSLVHFMEAPREHLIDTINALDEVFQAALILVYAHQGAFNEETFDEAAAQAVVSLTGHTLPRIQDSFLDLKGSFLRRPASGEQVWTFAHPTIADALTEILREKSHMMPAMLRGATIDTILSGFVCEGATTTRDALVIPSSLNGPLVDRLLKTPDETQRNWALFSFLAFRASDEVIRMTIGRDPQILERLSWITNRVNDNPKVNAYAKVHSLGLLDDELRNEIATIIEDAAMDDFDLSFFDDTEIMSLISPQRLISLGLNLRSRQLPDIEERIENLAEDANLDEDPEGHFESIENALKNIETLTNDDETAQLIQAARDKINVEIQYLIERKQEHDNENPDEDVDWGPVTSVSTTPKQNSNSNTEPHLRSIFDDIDQH